MKKTLALIAAALTLMLGSFIWFVVTWDPEKEESLTQSAPAPLLLGKNTSGSGAAPQSAAPQMDRDLT